MDRPERKDFAQRALLYAAMVAISMLYVEDALGDKSLST